MIKVYEIIEIANSRTVQIFKYTLILLVLCAIVYAIATFIKNYYLENKNANARNQKIIDRCIYVKEIVSIAILFEFILILGLAMIGPSKDDGHQLNKDQYSLQIVDNKLIQLKKDHRKLKMTVQKNGDSKESDADALEIVAETDEHYLCKANTSDRDTYVKVLKNEHNFVKESE